MSMRSFTPFTTIWTSSTSEKPNLSEFDMSKVPSVDAVSTPPVPIRKEREHYTKFLKTLQSTLIFQNNAIPLYPKQNIIKKTKFIFKPLMPGGNKKVTHS